MAECPSIVDPFFRGPPAQRVKRYRDRAGSLRAMAADFAFEWRDILMRLADSYEELAAATEEELASSKADGRRGS